MGLKSVILNDTEGDCHVIPMDDQTDRDLREVGYVREDWALMVNPEYQNGRGIFARIGHRGYTMSWRAAGRFSKDEAQALERKCPDKYTALPLPIVDE